MYVWLPIKVCVSQHSLERVPWLVVGETIRIALYHGWWDCVGIEPTRPGTQVSGSFEDCGGHQYPIQP
ncbi:hypothetical protein, partial [Neobacillus niacini]|uniref:hypothetical protein n=1 Tax=Neobacillus niacini TaxID=86668 RepID=UPI002FFD8097